MDTPNFPGPEDPGRVACASRPRISCLSCRNRKQKCDRNPPLCGRCAQLGLDCIYPSSRKVNRGKQRQVRDLEAKILQLEDRVEILGSGVQNQPQVIPPTVEAGRGCTPLRPVDDASRRPESDDHLYGPDGNSKFQGHSRPGGPITPPISSELQEILTATYFDKSHHGAPMIHHSRYKSLLRLSSNAQPPQCLQHAIMATGASADPAHASISTTLYEQARTLAEADDMKDAVGHLLSVAHAQCWLLIAYLEAQNGMFSRSFVSLARSIRIAQLLGLHQLDGGEPSASLIPNAVPPPRDWTELEERRRTWWVIYVSDRLVFATSGLPAAIDDRWISTRLPSSEESFEGEAEERTSTSHDALREELATPHSRLATRVLAAALYYKVVNFKSPQEMENKQPNGAEDEYWNHHQGLYSDLASVLLGLPQCLQLPLGSGCQHAVFIHVLIHTATMRLCKTAMQRARLYGEADAGPIARQSRSGIFTAATQILSILSSAHDLLLALKNPIQVYAAYIAALVFLEDFAARGDSQSRGNVVFLLDALRTAGQDNPVARMFEARLSAESERVDAQTTENGVSAPSRASVAERCAPGMQGVAGVTAGFWGRGA